MRQSPTTAWVSCKRTDGAYLPRPELAIILPDGGFRRMRYPMTRDGSNALTVLYRLPDRASALRYVLGVLGMLTAACTSTPATPQRVDASGDVHSPTDQPNGIDAVGMDSGEDGGEGSDAGGGLDAMTLEDRPVPPDVVRDQTEDARVPERLACAFGPGDFAVQTVGSEVPIGSEIPLDHILVLMQENRSFDHYFRTLPAAGQPDVDVASDTWSNRDTDGTVVTFHRDTQRCVADLNHEWSGVHAQYDNGAMDGFVTTNDPMGDRALTYYDHADLPFYTAVATTFAISDRYFAAALGPTWPNRLFFMAGTAFGYTANTFITQDTAASPAPQIFRSMDAAGITWKDYAGGPRMVAFFPYYGILRSETRAHLGSIDDLMADLAAGTLPQVSVIEPNYIGNGGTRVDEHPPGIPEVGEAFVEGIVRALMASPAWSRSALFMTYDEHGGFADHVPPPPACVPDDSPVTDGTHPVAGAFDHHGVRVPFMLVSPYARAHYVSHNTYDHTSLLRFIEARFDLPALTHRDANATVPTDLFDFVHPPFMVPPVLPHAGIVDPAIVAHCTMLFPSTSGL